MKDIILVEEKISKLFEEDPLTLFLKEEGFDYFCEDSFIINVLFWEGADYCIPCEGGYAEECLGREELLSLPLVNGMYNEIFNVVEERYRIEKVFFSEKEMEQKYPSIGLRVSGYIRGYVFHSFYYSDLLYEENLNNKINLFIEMVGGYIRFLEIETRDLRKEFDKSLVELYKEKSRCVKEYYKRNPINLNPVI